MYEVLESATSGDGYQQCIHERNKCKRLIDNNIVCVYSVCMCEQNPLSKHPHPHIALDSESSKRTSVAVRQKEDSRVQIVLVKTID